MPLPSSSMVMCKSSSLTGTSIQTLWAVAEIELSTISAKAVLNVYPIDLIEFISTLGDGVFSIFTDILTPPALFISRPERFP